MMRYRPWIVVLLLGLSASSACENDFYATPIGEEGVGAAGGDGGGGAGGGEVCAGQCVPNAPLGWSVPALLWAGDLEAAPRCPDEAPTPGYEGYSGFGSVPLDCGVCACDPPASVTCALPTTWNASSVACQQGAGVTTPFHAPSGWDGSCTAQDAIAANVSCNGSPCVRSLVVNPPVAVGGPCTPTPQVPPPASNGFSTFSRACVGNAYPPCASPGETCVPAGPEGFATCIFQKGDVACPAPWARKEGFYEEFNDGRSCTPCGCGPAGGASCIAAVSVYTDGTCSAPVGFLAVSSEDPESCIDLPTGSALGSKMGEVVSTQPGSCPPTGGEPVGDVEPNQPATFCCLE